VEIFLENRKMKFWLVSHSAFVTSQPHTRSCPVPDKGGAEFRQPGFNITGVNRGKPRPLAGFGVFAFPELDEIGDGIDDGLGLHTAQRSGVKTGGLGEGPPPAAIWKRK